MWSVNRDDAVLVSVALDNRDRAGLDYEEGVVRVPFLEQHLPGGDRAHLTDRAQPRPLVVAESGKRSIAVYGLVHAQTERFSHAESPSMNATLST